MWKKPSFDDHIFLSKWSKGEFQIFFLHIKVKQCVQSLSFPLCVALPASFGFRCGNFCATNSSDEKNVRHDCLLNLLICGPDPISHYTASATNALLSTSEEIFFSFFFFKGDFVFTSCFRCPACYLPLFQWLPLQSWASFKDEELWGGQESLYFHISALLE